MHKLPLIAIMALFLLIPLGCGHNQSQTPTVQHAGKKITVPFNMTFVEKKIDSNGQHHVELQIAFNFVPSEQPTLKIDPDPGTKVNERFHKLNIHKDHRKSTVHLKLTGDQPAFTAILEIEDNGIQYTMRKDYPDPNKASPSK